MDILNGHNLTVKWVDWQNAQAATTYGADPSRTTCYENILTREYMCGKTPNSIPQIDGSVFLKLRIFMHFPQWLRTILWVYIFHHVSMENL